MTLSTQENNANHDVSALLSVHDLNIDYADKKLVQQLNFKIYPAKTLAIVGESGSGKSISNLALLGLLSADLKITGKANFNHQGQMIDLLSISAEQQRHIRGRKIAMIFQEPMTALNPLHRVETIIGESLLLQGYSKTETRAKVIQLLHDVGIAEPEDKLKRYPHELSGGQRQRVMIASALALEPEILIADEPTTALDVTLQKQILELLKQLQQQKNMAMILISHDLNLVKRYADDVIVMQYGQVVEQGECQTLFSQPQAEYTKHLLNQDFGQALPLNQQAETILTIEQLTVKFPIKAGLLNRVVDYYHAVRSLSVQLVQGESLGIVGESGSGKTSFALAIARLIESEGKIILLNQNLNQLKEKQLRPLRQHFQIVFQDPFSSLNPRMTIAQIIGEGLQVLGINKHEIQTRVTEALQHVELPVEFATRYPHELSGGQRQRVSLARALILKPKLMILDEPTSALDRTTQRAIVQLLRQFQQQFGISYIFISHDLHVIRALCQNVLVLKNSEVVEYQATEQLFNSPQHDYTKMLIEASGV